MTRARHLSAIRDHGPFDIAIIGGGATGAGSAVDAAARGYSVALFEQSDFGKGTSSRSTKLVHGGVRYLAQGNVSLVMEALKERGLLRQNAPHLVSDLKFVVPNYDWWEAPFYGIGLRVYDLLAGKYGFGPSGNLSKEETLERLPTIKTEGLRGGVVYYDGQFDDARLLINLVQTAAEQGALLVNYARVTGLSGSPIDRLTVRDEEGGEEFTVQARVVVNATGAFTDQVRRMADPGAASIIAPSQGIHLVFDRSFLPGDSAIMVPHTSDGRVMFAIPWHGHTVVGTTDTPIPSVSLEPRAMEEEIEFILTTAAQYLHKAPSRADVLSVFTGIRPLIKSGDASSTAALARDHSILIDARGMLTIGGGKWTTYRKMAEDCINHAATLGQLEERPCPTAALNIHGWRQHGASVYGSDQFAVDAIAADEELRDVLHPALPYRGAEIAWAAREEMARTVDDALARRTRALILNARAAVAMAPRAAQILARELGRDARWELDQVAAFSEIAKSYVL